MGIIDLHIHSSCSDDGEFNVKQILDLSKEKSIKCIAITDHNSVRGVKEATKYGEIIGIDVIPGIELDCCFNGLNLHLLGYDFDYTNKIYTEIEKNIFDQEMKLAVEKIKKIKENTDLIIDIGEVLNESNGRIVTGELIAEILIKNPKNHESDFLKPYLPGGLRSDMPYVNFYWDYFSQGKLAYVPIKYISLKEAIDIIEGTGGIPVIAHPGNNLKDNLDIIYDLINEGIKGIEVFSSYHSDEQVDFFYNIAQKNNLIITCGTDFHGKNKPNIKLGEFKNNINYEKIIKGIKEK